jgi:hypothetical protein
MRIWSLHPKYLDTKGIVALWRETLLAKKVLEGKTRGYKNHPQLIRFRNSGFAVDGINQYLAVVYEDSLKRGYRFDRSKINWNFIPITLTVTDKQLKYEMDHLLKKLKTRDPELYLSFSGETRIEPHPQFKIIKGEIEAWEITSIY